MPPEISLRPLAAASGDPASAMRRGAPTARPFFWPINSTTVRSLKRGLALAALRLRYRLLARVSTERAIDDAARRFLVPPVGRFGDEELAALEEAHLLPVPFVTGRLVGWRWGRDGAPTVLLVHGWGGRVTQMLPFIAPLLASGHAVVAFDAPGHGMTRGRESSLVHFTAALDAILDALGPLRGIIGHSMGAAAAAAVAARRPEVAGALALIAPPASVEQASRRFAAVLGLAEPLRAAVQRRIEHRFGVRWADFEPERLVVDRPVLVVHDGGDREVPLAEGLRYARAWPNARLMQTAGLGHNRILNDAAVIAAAVSFVAEAAR